MKLLLVNAVNTDNISETVFPNLGLGYIASYLEKYTEDIEIKILNSNGRNIGRFLKKFIPDLVGISAVSQNFNYARYIAQQCAGFGIPVFMGGIHITCLPESLPEEMAFGVVGEGEETIRQIVEVYRDTKNLAVATLEKISGLVYRDESRGIKLTEERESIALETLPFPDREKLGVRRNDFTYMFSSRGCAFHCRFCCSKILWKKPKFFPAEYVIEEIGYLIDKFSSPAITFYDDDFLANRNRLEKIVSLMEQKNLLRKSEFNLMSRVDMITQDTVQLIKRMNVTVVSLGLESGSQETLDYLKCGTVTVKQNKHAIDLLNCAGIIPYGFFIIGSPFETEEDILKTYEFAKRSHLVGFSVYILVPYPGTEVWEYAKSRGLVSDNMDFSRLALNINKSKKDIIVVSSKVDKKRLYKLYWKFQRLRIRKRIVLIFKRVLKNPALILPRIKRIFRHYFLRK